MAKRRKFRIAASNTGLEQVIKNAHDVGAAKQALRTLFRNCLRKDGEAKATTAVPLFWDKDIEGEYEFVWSAVNALRDKASLQTVAFDADLYCMLREHDVKMEIMGSDGKAYTNYCAAAHDDGMTKAAMQEIYTNCVIVL